MIIEILDADYEDAESLKNLDNINTMRCGKYIKNAHYKMYLKYLTGGCNAKKNCKNFKNKERTLIFFCVPFFFFPVVNNQINSTIAM